MLAETVSDVQPVAAVPPAASNERRGKGPSIKESVLYIKEMLPHLEEEFIKVSGTISTSICIRKCNKNFG